MSIPQRLEDVGKFVDPLNMKRISKTDSESHTPRKSVLRELSQPRKGEEMNNKLIALDDSELGNWLIDLIADGSDNFLCALAEAVVTADAADYDVIRPALIELKRKSYNGERRRIPGCRSSASRGLSPQAWSVRNQLQ
jgi:hypothetical protein